MTARPRPLRLGRSFTPASHDHWGAGWLCRHCWHPQDGHHTNGRCYTRREMALRMAWYAQTGRWPGPEEGCGEGVLPPRRRQG